MAPLTEDAALSLSRMSGRFDLVARNHGSETLSGSPQAFRDGKRIDLLLLPPRSFVARLVQLMVMGCTNRNRELVAHL